MHLCMGADCHCRSVTYNAHFALIVKTERAQKEHWQAAVKGLEGAALDFGDILKAAEEAHPWPPTYSEWLGSELFLEQTKEYADSDAWAEMKAFHERCDSRVGKPMPKLPESKPPQN